MKTALKIFEFGIAAILIIALIIMGMSYFNKSRDLNAISDKNYNNMQTSLSVAEYSAYDGSSKTGSDVCSAIRLHASSNFTIHVKTNASSDVDAYTAPNSYTISDPTNADYIEPTGTFTSVLNKNSNGTPISITFTQRP